MLPPSSFPVPPGEEKTDTENHDGFRIPPLVQRKHCLYITSGGPRPLDNSGSQRGLAPLTGRRKSGSGRTGAVAERSGGPSKAGDLQRARRPGSFAARWCARLVGLSGRQAGSPRQEQVGRSDWGRGCGER